MNLIPPVSARVLPVFFNAIRSDETFGLLQSNVYILELYYIGGLSRWFVKKKFLTLYERKRFIFHTSNNSLRQ